MRAETLVLRQPALTSLPLTLEDALAAVGVAPRTRSAVRARRGLLWHWFAYEATWLACINTLLSVPVLLAAMTMTAAGMSFAVAAGLAPAVYRVLNDGLPWAALALLVAAMLKAGHVWVDRKALGSTRLFGYALAIVLGTAGLWMAVMLGYASVVPMMFKPVLRLAGGDATAQVAAANAAMLGYFEPAVIGGAALLLSAKSAKTSAMRRAPLLRRRIAFGGMVLSLIAVLLSAWAADRHSTGADARDGMTFAIGGDTLSGRDGAYGSLFAPGVPCHVSSLFGWRTDPVLKDQTKLHQGVDVAVRQGTPIHAMADGRVMFVDFDEGLGNFVALRTDKLTIINGHMESVAVHAGDVVHKGDVIGFVGSTGKSTGPHVHLQLCPGGHMDKGHLICGGATNPYENWPTLSALAQMSCVDGPRTF
ncbi:MAG: M23 family metallopeptidase [Alphaproteobacteria bacterium]|nr:M23 family metallopeptidase [Alphaproteobacteria bacterium]MBL7096666.1 M23 family metallopeptidase [Alphaproteobacteria bacterium]